MEQSVFKSINPTRVRNIYLMNEQLPSQHRLLNKMLRKFMNLVVHEERISCEVKRRYFYSDQGEGSQ